MLSTGLLFLLQPNNASAVKCASTQQCLIVCYHPATAHWAAIVLYMPCCGLNRNKTVLFLLLPLLSNPPTNQPTPTPGPLISRICCKNHPEHTAPFSSTAGWTPWAPFLSLSLGLCILRAACTHDTHCVSTHKRSWGMPS
jgi:hypothetical protein